jgi:outer membrane receptor protein involved in Fe transport
MAGLEAFFGYAENFKALNDLVLEREGADCENIDPGTSETLELGVRYDANGLRASAVIFQNDFENRLIFLAPDSEAGPNFLIGTNGAYFNAGGIESEGMELSVNYDINAAFSVYAAYTYIDATYLGSGDPLVDQQNGIIPGNTVAGIPENTFVTSLDWANDMIFAGLSVKYTGERFVNQLNTWETDSNVIADAYVGSNFDSLGGPLSNLRVNLVVNNLLDEEYLGTISSNAAWIGGPRTVSLSATVDF